LVREGGRESLKFHMRKGGRENKKERKENRPLFPLLTGKGGTGHKGSGERGTSPPPLEAHRTGEKGRKKRISRSLSPIRKKKKKNSEHPEEGIKKGAIFLYIGKRRGGGKEGRFFFPTR